MNETTKHPAHGEPGHSCEIEMQEKRAEWVTKQIEHARKPDAAEKWAQVVASPLMESVIPNGFDNIPDTLKGLIGHAIAQTIVSDPVTVLGGAVPTEYAFTLYLAIAEAAYRLGFEASLGKSSPDDTARSTSGREETKTDGPHS